MGMLYRRKKRDPVTGKLVECGPWWMKYYDGGKPIMESTGKLEKREASLVLRKAEGKVAEGQREGPLVKRTRFEDLVELIRQDYAVNDRKTARRLNEYVAHLLGSFRHMRASAITTDKILAFVSKRREAGASNGTVNRELGILKRMFRLAYQQTPPKVSRIPHIPMLEERNIRSGFFEHEDFLALRGALPDYAKVPATLAYYSGMRMGEVFSLTWDQVNLMEGKLFLKAQDTKTDTPRVLYLTGDLLRVLLVWKQRCEAKWPRCPWICHRGAIQLQSLKHSWRKACERVGLGRLAELEGTNKKKWVGRIPHDFRRTAVRNMVRAGVPEKVAMAISGHKTRSVFDRYNIVNEADLERAAQSMTAYFEREKAKMVTLTVTPAQPDGQNSGANDSELVGITGGSVELARGIEPPTCGLQNRCSAD